MEIIKSHSNLVHYYKIFINGLPHARNYGLNQAIDEIIIPFARYKIRRERKHIEPPQSGKES
ncbi:MAG: hypothetical protein AABZ43_02820 [Planctomycetota bacterium]